MGMSTHIVGFRDADENHKKKVAAVLALKAANIDIPQELLEYFGDDVDVYSKNFDEDCGLEVDVEEFVEEYNTDSGTGYEVRLEDLPKGVTMIRFYNAW